MKPTKTQLPEKLSDCLRLAMRDLEEVEKMPGVVVHMGEWMTNVGGTCYVCLAGSVMLNTLRTERPSELEWLTPSDASDSHRDVCRLCALNCLRLGAVGDAIEAIGEIVPEDVPWDIDVTQYAASSGTFKTEMNDLADLLESHGL